MAFGQCVENSLLPGLAGGESGIGSCPPSWQPGLGGKSPTGSAKPLKTGDRHLGTPCPARRRRFGREPGLAKRVPGNLGGWSPNRGGVAAAGSLRTASGVRKPFHAIPPGRRVRANPGLPASTPPALGKVPDSGFQIPPRHLSRIHAAEFSRGAAESAEREAGHEWWSVGNHSPNGDCPTCQPGVLFPPRLRVSA